MKGFLNVITAVSLFAVLLIGGSSAIAGGSASAATESSAVEIPCGFVESDCSAGPKLRFAGGEPSVDALVEKFLRAIEAKDSDGLRQLLVTKDEYQQIIAPGTFEKGEAPKRYSPAVQKYFWEDINYKNGLYAKNLIKGFGGRTFPTHEIRFTRPTREYGWYRAYGELRVDLATPPSLPEELSSGWIAELDGNFKFIGFGSDD